MKNLRCIFFYVFFYLWTISFFIVFSPVKLFSRDFAVFLSNIWSGVVIFLTKNILGVNYEIHGKNNLPRNSSILIASNHQSAWETFFFTFLFEDPVFVLKKELRFVPIMSWYFKKLDFIFIDRDKGANSLRIIINAINKLKGAPPKTFIIFPEGTRQLPEKKTSLNPGVFAIKKMIQIPIIPVRHNSGEYWYNKKFFKNPGTIKIEIFPEIK